MPSYKRLDETGASKFAEEIFTKVKEVIDDLPGGGSGNANAVDMTLAQYNALTQAQKNDGTIRFITDVNSLPRADGDVEPTLPAEYQEVEYITFSQSQYVTVENLESDLVVQILASASVTKSDNVVVGYKGAYSSAFDFEARFDNGTFNLWERSVDYSLTVRDAYPSGNKLNTVRELIIALKNHAIARFYIGRYAESEPSTYFGGNFYRAVCYSFEQVVGEISNIKKAHTFVPCYRKADDEAGIFDLYTNIFYTNEGSGTFVVGPDVV